MVIANEKHYKTLQKELSDQPNIKIYAGKEALKQIVEAEPINMVVTAMVGFAGLEPTIQRYKATQKDMFGKQRNTCCGRKNLFVS